MHPIGVAAGLVIAETALLVAIAIASGVAYHEVTYGTLGPISTFATVGCLAALCYIAPFGSSGDYVVADITSGQRSAKRVIHRWHAGLLMLALVGFLTKTTAVFSRGWLIIFYVAGLVSLTLLNTLSTSLVRYGVAKGYIVPRRLMLIGTDSQIAQFWRRRDAQSGDRVVSIAHLPDAAAMASTEYDAALDKALSTVVDQARAFEVETALLLSGPHDGNVVARCVEAMSLLPVAVHLDAGPALDRFGDLRVKQIGRLSTLALTDLPLSPLDALAKRMMDVVASLVGLVLLAPVFALVALAIKLDSKGPVFFHQRRRGYNQHEFRIVKFRTMTCLDDGDVIDQARQGDRRITRVGAYLRKLNIDELPQLWNVLRGEMSIVGPRPHAVAHDRLFETRIVKYARRLNVRPGITGWAQVHGFRGETDTDDKMRRRVEHDLHYIDNWSIWLDLYIVAMTVLSKRAFANAR